MGRAGNLLTLIVGVVAALPWLNPFVAGPSSSIQPWLVSFVCGVLLWLVASRLGVQLRPKLAIASAALLCWACFVHPPPSHEVAAWAGALTLMVLCASTADAAALSSSIRHGVLAAAVVSACFALIQYLGASGEFSPWISLAQPGEAFANLRQPNQFATLCAIGFAIVLWDTQAWPLGARLVMAVLLGAGSAASVSRTGLLQAIALVVLAMAWAGPGRRERLQLCAGAGLAYLLASLLLPMLLESFTGVMPSRTMWSRLGGEESCSSRSVLWGNVLHLSALQPLTGWGIGELDYAHFTTLYEGRRFCDILDNAHSLPLQLAVELGIPVATATCCGVAWWVVRQRPFREVAGTRRLAWALLLVIGLHSLLEYPIWYGPFQIICGIALGMLTGSEPVERRHAVPRHIASGLAAVLLVGAAYAWWDYLRVSQIYLPPEQRREPWRQDPLAAAKRSWLFANQAQFAELTLAPLTRANAGWMEATAEALLHYSPEPRVIERLIESATLNGHEEKAVAMLARYRAAFPNEYEQWKARQRPRQD